MNIMSCQISKSKTLLNILWKESYIIISLNLGLIGSSVSNDNRFLIGVFSLVLILFLLNRKRNVRIYRIEYNEISRIIHIDYLQLFIIKSIHIPIDEFECVLKDKMYTRFISRKTIEFYKKKEYIGDITEKDIENIEDLFNRLIRLQKEKGAV